MHWYLLRARQCVKAGGEMSLQAMRMMVQAIDALIKQTAIPPILD